MKKIVILLAVAVLSLGAANAQVKKTNAASSTASVKTETPAKACNNQDNKKQANTTCTATKSTCKSSTPCNGCKGHKSNCPQKGESPAKASKDNGNVKK